MKKAGNIIYTTVETYSFPGQTPSSSLITRVHPALLSSSETEHLRSRRQEQPRLRANVTVCLVASRYRDVLRCVVTCSVSGSIFRIYTSVYASLCIPSTIPISVTVTSSDNILNVLLGYTSNTKAHGRQRSHTVGLHHSIVRFRVIEGISGGHDASLEAQFLQHFRGRVRLVVANTEFFETWNWNPSDKVHGREEARCGRADAREDTVSNTFHFRHSFREHAITRMAPT